MENLNVKQHLAVGKRMDLVKDQELEFNVASFKDQDVAEKNPETKAVTASVNDTILKMKDVADTTPEASLADAFSNLKMVTAEDFFKASVKADFSEWIIFNVKSDTTMEQVVQIKAYD